MAASSTEGNGKGSARKPTSNELASLSNGPYIVCAGTLDVLDTAPASPPSESSLTSLIFPYPLPGGADNYVITLTTLNAGAAYVATRFEDEDNNFTGFIAVGDVEGTVMYTVVKTGFRPNV